MPQPKDEGTVLLADNSGNAELLRYIIDRVNLGIFILDKDFKITLWNQFMESHSTLSEAQAIGCDVFTAFPDLPKRWFSKKLQSVFMLGSYAFTSWEQRPYLFKFKHNRPATGGLDNMYQNVTLIPARSQNGDVEQVIVSITDATDEGLNRLLLQKTMGQLEKASRTDGLTGLFNRAYWEVQLKSEFDRCKRYGNLCSLVMLDIDHFKSINDQYGHLMGDQVIRLVSEVVLDSLREVDVAGRYGGEEFGILLPETSVNDAYAVAERIRLKIAEHQFSVSEKTIAITSSFGVAEMQQDMEHYEEFLESADEALFVSKDKGRNQTTLAETAS